MNPSRHALPLCLPLATLLVACTSMQRMPEESGDPIAVANSASYRTAVDAPRAERPIPLSGFDPEFAVIKSGAVVHYATWFNDPFADRGSDDASFGWTLEDPAALGLVVLRSIVNVFGLPISVAVTPLWQEVYSDGRVGSEPFEDHDVSTRPQQDAGGALIEPPLVLASAAPLHEVVVSPLVAADLPAWRPAPDAESEADQAHRASGTYERIPLEKRQSRMPGRRLEPDGPVSLRP